MCPMGVIGGNIVSSQFVLKLRSFSFNVVTCGQAVVASLNSCAVLSLPEKSSSASLEGGTTAWFTGSAWFRLWVDWKQLSGSRVFKTLSRSTLAGSAAIAPACSFTPTSSTSLRRGNVTVFDSASKRDAGQPLGDRDDSLRARNSTLAGSGALRSTLDRWRRRRFGQRWSRSAKNAALGPDLLTSSETTHTWEQPSSNLAHQLQTLRPR